MGKKKKRKRKKEDIYLIRAFGKELRMAVPWKYMEQQTDEQMLADTFPLLQAFAHQDHEYALYAVTPMDVLLVRHYGEFWIGGDDPREVSYEVSFYKLNPETWEIELSSEKGGYSEPQVVALLEAIQVPIHEAVWLAADIWRYVNVQRRVHHKAFLMEQIKQAREKA